MKRVELIGIHLTAGSGLPVVLLRESDEPRRLLQVFIGPTEANAIAMAVSGRTPPRPMTHDLMTDVLSRLQSHVDAVEVTELTDGTFHAELIVGGPGGLHRIDSRPSDGIALAVRSGAPIFASERVLREAGAFVAEDGTVTDAGQIEAQVEEFRSQLADFDLTEFDPGGDDPSSAGEPPDGEPHD